MRRYEKSGQIARTVVISFDAGMLWRRREELSPSNVMMTGLLHDGQIEKPLERALEIGARQVAVRGDLVSPWLLADARKKDLQVVCWTVNHSSHMRLLSAAGVDGIISDYPDRLMGIQRRPKQKAS